MTSSRARIPIPQAQLAEVCRRHRIRSALFGPVLRDDFRTGIATNRMLQLSLNYLILVVGEAATRVSTAGRARYLGIPFSKLVNAAGHV